MYSFVQHCANPNFILNLTQNSVYILSFTHDIGGLSISSVSFSFEAVMFSNSIVSRELDRINQDRSIFLTVHILLFKLTSSTSCELWSERTGRHGPRSHVEGFSNTSRSASPKRSKRHNYRVCCYYAGGVYILINQIISTFVAHYEFNCRY